MSYENDKLVYQLAMNTADSIWRIYILSLITLYIFSKFENNA